MNKKINLIFSGGFTYPYGMASTKRIQNIINALKGVSDVSVRVIILRQRMDKNDLSGVHEGTPYEIIMGDLFKLRMFLLLPMLYYKTIAALKRARKPRHENIIYFYGPIFIDSVLPLYVARMLGYKIVFDVIEDFGLARDVTRTIYRYVRSRILNWFSLRIKNLASGIVVISSYLQRQSIQLTQNKIPIHYMPISVDMDLFPEHAGEEKIIKTLFYAGSFSKKDGVPILLDAFDKLSEGRDDVRLVLTGRGDKEAMEEFFARIEMSPYKERIEYKGYLNEEEYNSLLISSDVLCMTRVDLAFAQAGFPFKLGEYLATGKPVIASMVSDVESFLENKTSAMLVTPGSSKDVCEAAEFLLNEREAAGKIGKRGREVAISFFDNKRQGKELLTFLESM